MPAPDSQIVHKHNFKTGVAVDTEANIANCTEVNNAEFDNIAILVTAYDSATGLTFWTAHTSGGTYAKLHTAANAAEAIVVSAVDRSYLLPAALRPFPFFKICCNAGTLTVTVVRKS